MKTKLSLLTILFCPLFIFGQTWEYPVKPGTEEWKKLKTYEEHINAYNIPIDLLDKITTKDLLKTCLNYPEWRLINAYDNLEIGFFNIISMFNGFNELLKRQDSEKELMNIYIVKNPMDIKKSRTELEKGQYSFDILCIELLLSHRLMIRQLDKNNLKYLLNESVNKFNEKAALPEEYSYYSLMPTAILCLRTMQALNVDSPLYKKFNNNLNSKQDTKEYINFIIDEAKNYMK